MHFSDIIKFSCCIILIHGLNIGCNNQSASPKIVDKPKPNLELKSILEAAKVQEHTLENGIQLHALPLVNLFYSSNEFKTVWSNNRQLTSLSDSLIGLINYAELFGLFPSNYHSKELSNIQEKLITDSLHKLDASHWNMLDILLTDAYFSIVKDLKIGRLQNDSILQLKDPAISPEYFINTLQTLVARKNFSYSFAHIQPPHRAYWNLINALPSFVDSMSRKEFTYVKFVSNYKTPKDSIDFIKTVQKRLYESNCIADNKSLPDSTQLADAILKYQKNKGIKEDGKLTSSLVRVFNNTDAEKFKRIAITLDKYKQLPRVMPEKYIWVNLPAYHLSVFDSDTIALESKIICGKPSTPTPHITSSITDMVIYPTWTVPNSIIVKQYLPKLKNNPNYLNRIGLKIVNAKGEHVSAETVSWQKYSKGIPYKVMQESGDNNALGVFKFNFDNPHAVYLHDTNQRYLFKNSSRAFSHGCVRVQEWEKLAYYIARNDSVMLEMGDTLRYTTDSIKNWIESKQRKRIAVKNKINLYIRYFSCDGINGKVKFYEDIYGEDAILRQKYFK